MSHGANMLITIPSIAICEPITFEAQGDRSGAYAEVRSDFHDRSILFPDGDGPG